MQSISKRCPNANVKNKHITQEQKTEYLRLAKLLERKHIVKLGGGTLYRNNNNGRD
jgi:hypothetical protein